ncbi:MAG TPA: hypothetical protein VJ851_09555 [Jatrophihabitans sp.]|nr:hypothetical protein [Jatrophihabitans sp.]
MTSRWVSAATIGTLLACTACVAPASSTANYQGKAGHTASAALSELETARLATETARRGRMLRTTLEIMLSQAEDAFSSIEATFDSIQPPNTQEADRVRDKLDQILAAGLDGITRMRIAVRRNDTGDLYATSTDLDKISQQLQAFSEQPGA